MDTPSADSASRVPVDCDRLSRIGAGEHQDLRRIIGHNVQLVRVGGMSRDGLECSRRPGFVTRTNLHPPLKA
jgi:hypothetical protein